MERVRESWDPPVWLDLAAYGLYALEAAVEAAALHHGLTLTRNHWSKADAAQEMAAKHDLPDVSSLMRDLNEIRKSEAYGDVSMPSQVNPEDVAQRVEQYIDMVGKQLDI